MYSFKTASGAPCATDDVIREIVAFINAAPEREHRVIIGTDSQEFHDHTADFVTAIVVHRKGNGGRYFWRRIEGGTFHQLRDRIMREVMLSLEVAKVVLERLKKESITSKWSFEIHADVGVNGPTKLLIQEVVGIIRANDFVVHTKPDSYAASKVADRHC